MTPEGSREEGGPHNEALAAAEEVDRALVAAAAVRKVA